MSLVCTVYVGLSNFLLAKIDLLFLVKSRIGKNGGTKLEETSFAKTFTLSGLSCFSSGNGLVSLVC